MLKRYFQLACVAVFILSGCAAPTQKMSAEDRNKTSAVRVSEAQPKAEKLFILAPGTGVGLMFGAVGGALAAGGIQDATTAFAAYAEKNNISIEKIVREEVIANLRESGKMPIAAESDTSAPQMRITVQQYGFGVPTLLSSKVVPVMMLKCEIIDQSGKVLWQAGESVGPSIASPFESVSWEDMQANPKVIEQSWRIAAKHLAKKMINEL